MEDASCVNGELINQKSMITTSDCTLSAAHGGKKPNPSPFPIMLRVCTVLSDPVLHGRWLPAEQLHVVQYMHMRCNIWRWRVRGLHQWCKQLTRSSYHWQACWQSWLKFLAEFTSMFSDTPFKIGSRDTFLGNSNSWGVIPSIPSNGNSIIWEQDCR